MKKSHIGIIALVLVAFLVGYFGRGSNCVATVDVRQVLTSYPAFVQVKRENAVKLNELAHWLDTVTKEVDAEKDKTKREKLAAQYRKLALEKETLIKQDYDKRVQAINETVANLINEVAHKEGCKLVLASTSVVSGGKNITPDVLQKIKAGEK